MKHLPTLKKILFALAIFSGAYVFSTHTSTQAQVETDQSSRSITAIPPRAGDIEPLQVKPGETIQTSVQVRNNSQSSLTIRSYVKDFIVKEDGKTPIPVEESVNNRWSLAQWMSVVPNQHTLGTNEIAEMAVVIEIPEDALPGGRYAMVLHEPVSAVDLEQFGQSASGVTQKVGTLFYVIVDGPINEEAYIREFEFNKFQEFGPVPFSYYISNQSDVHIRPAMNIDIFNMVGQKVDSLRVDSNNIFPLNRRDFGGKWDRIWGFGLYTARLTAAYGSTGQVALASTNFWIVPVRLILAIVFVVLLLVAVIITVKRHTEYKILQEQQKLKEMQEKLDADEGEDSSGMQG